LEETKKDIFSLCDVLILLLVDFIELVTCRNRYISFNFGMDNDKFIKKATNEINIHVGSNRLVEEYVKTPLYSMHSYTGASRNQHHSFNTNCKLIQYQLQTWFIT